ncbi:MAG: hypothetical protein PVI57_22785, partial [Gemmatimonadota bacterium]
MRLRSRRHAAQSLLPWLVLVLPPPLVAQEREPMAKSGWDHLAGLPRDFASDAWAVTAAPFRLRGSDAWTFAGVLGTAGILFALDDEIRDEVRRRHPTSDLSQGVEDVGESLEPVALMGNTNAYYGAAIVAGSLFDWDRVRVAAEQLLFSHWIASLTRKGIGGLVGRRRPEEGRGPYVFDRFEGTSFPSGHASTAIQVAAVLSHHI